MSKITAALLTIVAVAAFAIFSLGLGYIGFSNDANAFEVDIKAKYADNKNVYDNGWKKVKEVAQVPDMQVEALQKVYRTALEARYGTNGSAALFQFIREQNPDLNQTTFLKIQQDIEAFRMEFQANQTNLVSRRQAYERFLTASTSTVNIIKAMTKRLGKFWRWYGEAVCYVLVAVALLIAYLFVLTWAATTIADLSDHAYKSIGVGLLIHFAFGGLLNARLK